jgi:hypothetical protein
MSRLTRDDIRDVLVELGRWEVVTPKVANDVAEIYEISGMRVALMALTAGLPITRDKIKARQRDGAVLPSVEQVEAVYDRFGAEAEARRDEQQRIEAAEARAADRRATLLLKRVGAGIGLLILVFVGALIWRAVTREPTQVDNAGPSDTYAQCEARLKPKLEQCLQVQPESSWGLCRTAYLDDMQRCTS